MSATIIDLPRTADLYRAAKATGQTARIAPAEIRVRIGDQVHDATRNMSGHVTHFWHHDGNTMAVVRHWGCCFTASLIDLVPLNQQH